MSEKIKNKVGRPKKNIETKAVTSWSGTVSSIQNNIPQTVNTPNDPVSLMSYNQGYVFACVNKIAAVISGLPFKLYSLQDVNNSKPFSKKLSNFEQKKLALETKYLGSLQKKELVEIYNHPFIDLINQPFTGCTISNFFYLIASYLSLIGNAYVVKLTDEDNQLTGLQVLQSEYVSIKYDTTGTITKFIYQPMGCRSSLEFEPKNILHFMNKVAGSIIAGRGELESALTAFSVANASLVYTKTLLNNNQIPGNMIVVKNKIGSSDAATKMAQNFAEQFSGNSRGKNIVTFGDISVEKIDTSLNDSLTDKFYSLAKAEIASVFGVPLSLLDESNSNRATALVAQSSFNKYTIFPKIGTILDTLNNEIVKPYYDDSLLFWYNSAEAIESDPVEQMGLLKEYVNSGIMTVSEARNQLGLAELPV